MRTGSLCLVLLVAVVAGSCKLPDEPGCAEGAPCPPGQRCLVSEDPAAPADSELDGVCAAVCQRSSDCDALVPLCDRRDAVCRSCFPGEDALCAGRSPETPSCDGGRCVACRPPRGEASEAAECAARSDAAPVCDRAAARCRSCQRHGECDSGVCVKDASSASAQHPVGSCLPSSEVLVVDPSLCSGIGPVFCTPAQALQRIDATHRHVLLRRSAEPTDFSDLTIGGLPAQQGLDVRLIGPLADRPPHTAETTPSTVLGGVVGHDALIVKTKARVTVEGLYFLGARSAIACTGPDASVRILRSLIAGSETAVSVASGCSLGVEESWLGRGPDGSAFLSVPANVRGIDVSGSDFRIVNSVLVDNGNYARDAFGGVRVHSLGGKARSLILNSTLYQQTGVKKLDKYFTSVLCDLVVGDQLVIMNTLFLGDKALLTAPEEHYVDTICGAALRHVASNDPLLASGDSLVLPMDVAPLVSAPKRDLRPSLRSNEGVALQQSGTVRADVGGQGFSAPLVDLTGQPRPSDRVTVGAFEAVVP